MNITISVHLAIYIAFMLFFVYKTITVESDGGDWSGLERMFYILVMIFITAIYGGIYWW
jgi:hypothetical protein